MRARPTSPASPGRGLALPRRAPQRGVHAALLPMRHAPHIAALCRTASACRYDGYFRKLDPQGFGRVSAEQARPLFLKAGLPEPTLAEIWALADADRDTLLSPEEFRVAMHLATVAARGEPLPRALPPQPPAADADWLVPREDMARCADARRCCRSCWPS